ncbi:MAG: hypothetical protein AAGJ83_10920, partial [Planctomycetota bacterium]
TRELDERVIPPLQSVRLNPMKSHLLCLTIALLVSPAVAQETKKRDRAGGRMNPANFVLKQFKEADLTDEQEAKIKELAQAYGKETLAMREKVGLTAEIMKKRAAAQKELKESGLKAKELAQAVNEKAGITKEQAAVLQKSNTLRIQMIVKAYAMLTADQQGKLPERIQTTATKEPAKGKGKGKKKGKGAKDSDK